jgi:non-ribosomal peptide synthetase component F
MTSESDLDGERGRKAVVSMVSVRCPVLHRVAVTAAEHAGRDAVVGAGQSLTYARLWSTVERVGAALREAAPANSVVAISTRGGDGLPAAFLGVRAAGMVPFLLDAYLPKARLDALLATVGPAAVIDETRPCQVCPGGPDPLVLPAGAGYLVFTSGSQGTPKGIVGNAEGLARFLDWEAAELGLAPGNRTAMLTSPSFDVVLREMLVPLVSGGSVHIAGPRVRTDPRAVLGWLADERIELVHLVPSLSARWASGAGATAGSLRWSVFAGEPLFARHVRRWRQVAPASRIGNLYGPSETTLAKFWHRVDDPGDGPVPVGRPLPGTVLRQLPMPEGTASPGAFRVGIETPDGSLGYLRPDQLGAVGAALWRAGGVTSFETQDRGRLLPDGTLLVEGRLDAVVKRRGAAVDTAGIAAAALRDPRVEAACCFQVDRDGNGDLVLVLQASPRIERATVLNPLRAALGPAMPDVVVACAELPRLPSGKVDAGTVARQLAVLPATSLLGRIPNRDERARDE